MHTTQSHLGHTGICNSVFDGSRTILCRFDGLFGDSSADGLYAVRRRCRALYLSLSLEIRLDTNCV